MTNLTDLSDKERAFLENIVNLGAITPNMGSQEVAKYKDKYGCDPCDACGDAACADCKGCIESYASHGKLNPSSTVSR